MKLIQSIEISYFRSLYKTKIYRLDDMNIIFGKNDSGKSNIVKALNLFFNNTPDGVNKFDFDTDFCTKRSEESGQSDDIRKFLYIKITFHTPVNFRNSLGSSFYVKRQWTTSRSDQYIEEYSSTIPKKRHHIVTRFLNKIRFIYIPAVKDITIFQSLLSNIYDTLSARIEFEKTTEQFTSDVRRITSSMFSDLPQNISEKTTIGAPTQMANLFKTLDFETTDSGNRQAMSLTRQRGDGIKARHIPELIKYICANDSFDYHILGFEEPENSLDFSASQEEAHRLLKMSEGKGVQMFLTTHSPSFYIMSDNNISKTYVKKSGDGMTDIFQGKSIEQLDYIDEAKSGFYLPYISVAIKDIAEFQQRTKLAEESARKIAADLQSATKPVILTEGRTDKKIIETAWTKLRNTEMPFNVESCESAGENAGSGNGGAGQLQTCLKAVRVQSNQITIGIFDSDDEGIKNFSLDRNFTHIIIENCEVKKSISGKSFAILLPAPEFRSECKEYSNLPIEFMFPDEAIARSVDGKSLILKKKFASIKLGTKVERRELGEGTHFKEIEGGKVDFASLVVPALDTACFIGFENLFRAIENIISQILESVADQPPLNIRSVETPESNREGLE